MQNKRYPNIHIQSKNELAKHISHSSFSKTETLSLINDVIKNFDKYWRDNTYESEPTKDKYVRTAKRTPLGKLLDQINKMVLVPHDEMLPDFIFGGISGLNHVKAAEYLLGKKRFRVALKMDIRRFFEQIDHENVYHLFVAKFGCSKKASKLLADLCCVSIGPKGSENSRRTIARGFATSSRLAVWCNLDTFIRLNWLVKKNFHGRDPRLAIYVDDIGITASKLSREEMEDFSKKVQNLLEDRNLIINNKKTKISSHEEGIEHLGIRLERNSLDIGAKTKSKIDRIKRKMTEDISVKNIRENKSKLRSLYYYKRYLQNPNKG